MDGCDCSRDKRSALVANSHARFGRQEHLKFQAEKEALRPNPSGLRKLPVQLYLEIIAGGDCPSNECPIIECRQCQALQPEYRG